MIPFMNEISSLWYDYFLIATFQNSIYIGLILTMMTIFRNKDIRFLRILAIIGFLKLLLPPIIKMPVDTHTFISEIKTLAVTDIVSRSVIITGEGISLQSWFFFTWISLSLLFLCIVFLRTMRLKDTFNTAKPINISNLSDHHLAKKINFFKSNKNHSPLLIGLIRKKVIVPKDWDSWTETCKSTVITHELNHIQNRDPWYNLLRTVLLALNFFNPLVWILSNRLIVFSEMVCDDVTIEYLDSTTTLYSKQLVDLSAGAIHSRQEPSISLAFSESYTSMKNRISYQLSKKEGVKMKKMSRSSIIISFIIFSSMVLFSWQCESNEIIGDIDTPAEEVYAFSEVTVKPLLIEKGMPQYPEEARKAGLTGLVVVSVTIDKDGNVATAEIFKALNDSVKVKLDENGKGWGYNKESVRKTSLDIAALEAAKKCKFKPAIFNGESVSVLMNIPYKFALK